MAHISLDDSGIIIEGHVGTWFVLYSHRSPEGVMYFTLEHEQYGSDAEWLYVDADGKEIEDDDVLEAIVNGEYEEVA